MPEGIDKKSTIRNVATLMSGTFLAQIVSLISLPILQRYFYTPEDFGNFMWFFEFVAIFATIGALRLETGVILEKEERSARILTELSIKILIISSLVGLIFAIIGSFFSASFNTVLNNSILFFLIPIGIFSIGLVQIFNSWFTRAQKFKTIAVNKLGQNTFASLGQFGFAITKLSSLGLILGRVFGNVYASIFLGYRYFKNKSIKNKIQKNEEIQLLKKHKNFVLFTTPGTLIGTYINFLLIDLFLYYYGASVSGEIGASKYYIGVGFSLFSTAFAQVFYSDISKIHDKKQLRDLYTYWLKRLVLIGVLAVFVIFMIPNTLVVLILGEKWSSLLPTLKIMSIWMSVMFVSSSLSYIYIKLNRQKTTLIFDIFHLIVIYLSVYISFKLYNDFYVSLIWFTLAQTIYYILAIFAAYFFMSKYNPKEI